MTRLLLLCVSLAACGAPDAESCGFEDASYLAVYQRLNGNCPDQETRLVMPNTGVPRECTQSTTYDDTCGVTVTRDCQVGVDTVRSLRRLHPSGSGYEGTEQVQLLIRSGGDNCSSLYRVTYTPQ